MAEPEPRPAPVPLPDPALLGRDPTEDEARLGQALVHFFTARRELARWLHHLGGDHYLNEITNLHLYCEATD